MAQFTLLSFYNLVKPQSGGKLIGSSYVKPTQNKQIRVMEFEQSDEEEGGEENQKIARQTSFMKMSNKKHLGQTQESPSKDITQYFKRGEIKHSRGEKLQLTSSSKRSYSSFNSDIMRYFKKDDIKQNRNTWPFIPNAIMNQIMQYLTMGENAKLSLVCKYWKKCFNSIWLSYDFFCKFSLNQFSSKQINKILEKSSRMAHMKKVKSILNGKKVDSFMKRANFSSTIVRKEHKNGQMFESISLEPNKPNTAIFLTDREICDFCESSKFSLLYIMLVSCQLLTEKSFNLISKCVNLQTLIINYNFNLNDENLKKIAQNCKSLTILNLSGCTALTGDSLYHISVFCSKLEVLDISVIPKLTTGHLNRIGELCAFKKLNLMKTMVNMSELKSFLAQAKKLTHLSLEKCDCITPGVISYLVDCNLVYLNLRDIKELRESDIWQLVLNNESLVDLIVTQEIFSKRVEQKLLLNKRFTTNR